MGKNFNREIMWHLRYIESLVDAFNDTDINEEIFQKAAFNMVSIEKVLNDALPQGGQRFCPICGKTFHAYLPFGEFPRKSALCPACHSLERHRALWLILNAIELEKSGMKILHFAPEPIFYQRFSSIPNVDYWSVDLNPNSFGVKKVVDITDITFEDNTFDLIMCTHVLEHIPDEKKAMSELYRVLKPNEGVALLTVPIDNTLQMTLENPMYNTPALRSKYYGQWDHVRRYGLDYPQRLKDAKFFVEEVAMKDFFNDDDLKKFGLIKNEKFHICRKLIG